MKKSIIAGIHFAFWLSYFLLLTIIVVAATNNFSSGPGIKYIVSIGIPFVVVPSWLSFYLFYYVLFPLYSKEKETRSIGHIRLVDLCFRCHDW
jgi:hypothetical protein